MVNVNDVVNAQNVKSSLMLAIREAIDEEMARDPRVLVLGVDVIHSIMGITKGLSDKYPDRIINTPIAENAFSNVGVGMALTGMRPLIEITFSTFVTLAWNSIAHNATCWRYMHGGQFSVPYVLYCNDGAAMSMGAHHSQTLAPLFASIPGLKVVAPSNPADAKGLMKAAIRDNDPVLFFSHLGLNGKQGEIPGGDHIVPMGQAAICRSGKDVTIVAIQQMVDKSLAAAEVLAKEGIEAEVIDPRSIVPIDYTKIVTSVKKTGRLVTVEESRRRFGLGSELAAVVQEKAFSSLKSPIQRVGAPSVHVPGSPVLEKAYVPQEESILAAVRKVMGGEKQ